MILIAIMIRILIVLMTMAYSTVESSWNVLETTAMAGEDVILNCGEEELFLDGPGAFITWFKEIEQTTARGTTSLSRLLHHYPNVHTINNSRRFPIFCSRKNSCQNETALILRHVGEEDSGMYRCRVQYETIPAEDYYIRLSVDARYFLRIHYTDDVVVHKKVQKNGSLPMLMPGVNITLHCEAPLTWYSEAFWVWRGQRVCESPPHTLIAGSEYECTNVLKYTNKRYLNISISNINENIGAIACVGQHNNSGNKTTNYIYIPVHSPPKIVRILNDSRIQFGHMHEIICEVKGPNHYPSISWYLNHRKLYSSFKETSNNKTLVFRSYYYLNATTTLSYHLKHLTCSAFSPIFPDKVLNDTITLTIGYKPKCVHGARDKRIFVMPGETAEIRCYMDARPDPPEYHFYWESHRQSIYTKVEYPEFANGVKINNGTTYGRIFIHENDTKIGTRLICESHNEFGPADRNATCTFSVARGGLPLMPRCEFYNHTHEISCKPNPKGGTPITIFMAVYDEFGTMVINDTMENPLQLPEFLVVSYFIAWGTNEWGDGEKLRVHLRPLTLTSPAPTEAEVSPPSWPVWLTMVVALVSGIGATLLALAACFLIRRWSKPRGAKEVEMRVLRKDDGSFHREPDVEDDTLFSTMPRVAANTTNITVNQLANCANVESANCRVIVKSVPPSTFVPERTHYYV